MLLAQAVARKQLLQRDAIAESLATKLEQAEAAQQHAVQAMGHHLATVRRRAAATLGGVGTPLSVKGVEAKVAVGHAAPNRGRAAAEKSAAQRARGRQMLYWEMLKAKMDEQQQARAMAGRGAPG